VTLDVEMPGLTGLETLVELRKKYPALPVVMFSALTERAAATTLEALAPVLSHPAVLAEVDPDSFDLVFYPGGHGPMEDLAVDAVSGALLAHRLDSDRPLALLCHAPAAVLAATTADGTNPFAGRRMTGLSNVEEKTNPFAWKAKWLLQDKLDDLGVDYSKALLPFRPHIVVDGTLYTGQNPQSSHELAERLIHDLG
jgi:putative intracellular protease/amidase